MDLTGNRVMLGAVLAASLAVLGATAPAAAAPTDRHALDREAPSWATGAADRGPVAADTPVTARLYLSSRDPAGLARYAAAVSDPRDPAYRHHLSTADTERRFGTSAAQFDAVTRWLRGAGLSVSGRTAHTVRVRGDAGTLGTAFGTSLHTYTHAGETVRAPATAPSVPAALAADVLTVSGLSTAQDRIRYDAHPSAAAATKLPCSDHYGQKTASDYPDAYGRPAPYAVCGYTPAQLRGAYGVTGSGLTGAGSKVAIVGAYASTTIRSDADTWSHRRGESGFHDGQLTQSVPRGTTYDAGWAGEETLDVEAVHAMAPDADIVYVAAKKSSNDDLLDALNRVVDHRLADLVTNSWGSDEHPAAGMTAAFGQTFQRGATEGIGFYFSSGDTGGLNAKGKPVTAFPADDPWVTAVGGTSLAVDEHADYQWETGWESDFSTLDAAGTGWAPALPGPFTSGAGGGTSAHFAQPDYQRGVVPARFSTAHGADTPRRTIPDIAAVGDPTTGILMGGSAPNAAGTMVYAENRIGGTSLACPLIAGIQALAEQAQHGTAIGFANPMLYAAYGTPAFHDVTDHPHGHAVNEAAVRSSTTGKKTVVTLASLGRSGDAGLATAAGYDTTTGIGTPTARYLDSFRR